MREKEFKRDIANEIKEGYRELEREKIEYNKVRIEL